MPVSDTPPYKQEDIQQILHLAIARQADDGEFTREQLAEIATELNITSDCLAAAEQEWLARQGELQKRQDFHAYRLVKLKQHFGKYAIVNSFLIPLNFLSAGGELSWSLYILLLWGLGLGLKAWNTYQFESEEYERAFQHWYRQHQLRQSVNNFFSKLLKSS